MDAALLWAAGATALAVAFALPRGAWGRLDAVAPGRARPGARTGSRWSALVRWGKDRGRAVPPPVGAADVARACLLLAVSLEAGRPPRSALRVVVDVLDGPAAEALAGVLAQVDLGIDEAVAWAGLAEVPGYRAMARDLARAVHSGVALAALLRRHANEARREALLAAQVRARTVGVVGVLPVVVCFLPAFLLLGVVPIFGGLLGGLFR